MGRTYLRLSTRSADGDNRFAGMLPYLHTTQGYPAPLLSSSPAIQLPCYPVSDCLIACSHACTVLATTTNGVTTENGAADDEKH